ncbi:MAG: pyrroline-5-carboxylate reductase [Thermoflexales bacterium]|nr:pyrroline-5-carboxylate reductase [Thermoflexales bacterium]
MLDELHVAFIGGGVMGEAMIKSLLRSGAIAPERITLAEPNPERRILLSDAYGVHAVMHNAEAVRSADVVVLAIKPQVMNAVLHDLQGAVLPEALIFSIAAGIPIARIQAVLGQHQPVVRVMPNTPAQIGCGISVWTCTPNVSERQRRAALTILNAMGEEIFVEDEDMLDMATALSGTGPAYVFLFMEALIDAGVHLGFSRPIAEKLVVQTIKGSIEYAIASRLHPAQLRNQVTSPGGTTAAALYELEKGGLRTVISRAVWAAYRRSVELGKSKEGSH